MCDPDFLSRLDTLHAGRDGPIPVAARHMVRLGGTGELARLRLLGTQQAAARTCTQARAAIAARRRGLDAAAAGGDGWLRRLGLTLAEARGRALSAVDQSRLWLPSQSGDLPVALQPQK